MRVQFVFQFGNPARVKDAYQLIKSTHSHTAIMTKTEQIDAAARGILNVSAHANALQTGVTMQFRLRSIFLAQQSLQRSEGMFRKGSFHDNYAKM